MVCLRGCSVRDIKAVDVYADLCPLGMTELSTIVTSTSEHDILNKSSGSLCPATKAKIIGLDGKEVTKYDTPGELWIQSPSAALGYLNNQKATAETFVYDEGGRWVKTGDGEYLFQLQKSRPQKTIINVYFSLFLSLPEWRTCTRPGAFCAPTIC